MRVVEKFREIAARPEFKGWPLVGEPKLGEKIPFFGQQLHYQLQTPNGVEDYTSLLRHFGWVVVFGITYEVDRELDQLYPAVVTLVQWKPGVNQASWELAPGGIGRVKSELAPEELLVKTQEHYLRETGFGGGTWYPLGHVKIETGKYRGAGPDDHGLPAHMYLATNLEKMAEGRKPAANEIIETLLVPLAEFEDVVDSGLFVEASAVPCALLALRKLRQLGIFEKMLNPMYHWEDLAAGKI